MRAIRGRGGKDRSEGMCWNCGKTGRRSHDCFAQKGEGKGKGKGDNKGFKGRYKKEARKGKGKGLNAFDEYGQQHNSYYAPPHICSWNTPHSPHKNPSTCADLSSGPQADTAVDERNLGLQRQLWRAESVHCVDTESVRRSRRRRVGATGWRQREPGLEEHPREVG